MIIQWVVNLKYLKFYLAISLNEFTFHFFFWHLAFGFWLSDFGPRYTEHVYWQGIMFCWSWVDHWVDGESYQHCIDLVFKEILAWELYKDKQLKLGMSGII